MPSTAPRSAEAGATLRYAAAAKPPDAAPRGLVGSNRGCRKPAWGRTRGKPRRPGGERAEKTPGASAANRPDIRQNLFAPVLDQEIPARYGRDLRRAGCDLPPGRKPGADCVAGSCAFARNRDGVFSIARILRSRKDRRARGAAKPPGCTAKIGRWSPDRDLRFMVLPI